MGKSDAMYSVWARADAGAKLVPPALALKPQLRCNHSPSVTCTCWAAWAFTAADIFLRHSLAVPFPPRSPPKKKKKKKEIRWGVGETFMSLFGKISTLAL